MVAVGQIANVVGIISFALSIPVGILAGILTPKVSAWWASRNEIRKARRIAKLRSELQKLTATVQEPSRDGLTLPEECPLSALRLSGGPELRIDSMPNGRIYTLLAQNVETKYENTAHHLRAELLFTSFRGESVRVHPATFAIEMRDDDGETRLYFTAKTALGMGSCVAIAFLALISDKFYTVNYDLQRPGLEHELPLGLWTVNVRLSADNSQATAKYKLELGPKGSYGITPVIDIADIQAKVTSAVQ